MAEINSFPNNSDEYIGAEEVMRWLHGRTKGVYAGSGNAAVTAVDGSMQVSVAPGIGWITDANDNGVCWWFDTAITLTIDAAESSGTLNRIDRVIVEWQTTDYAALPEVKILKGTSQSSATPPALTNTGTVRQLSLARISIPAGTTQLTSLNIIDERMDSSVCGIVTETATADTSMIAAQYQEVINTLESVISQAWSGTISDGSISTAKLANSAVSATKIADGAVVTSKIGDGAVTPAKVDNTLLSAVCDMIYPIGSIYMSVNSTSPASRFGGTWERIKDKFLLSSGDVYSAGSTGGSATKNLQHAHTTQGHALSQGEMPSYSFGFFPAVVPAGHGTWNNAGVVAAERTKSSSQNLPKEGTTPQSGNTAYGWEIRSNGGNQSHSHGNTGNSGSTAQDIMPPYMAVYVWKRVS